MPSLSVSGTGHPSYFATPGTVGHLSLLSNTPSPSVSLSTGGGTTTTVGSAHGLGLRNLNPNVIWNPRLFIEISGAVVYTFLKPCMYLAFSTISFHGHHSMPHVA